MSMTIVTNAGPLMVFSKLNLLHLLETLYGHVIIPDAVYHETVVMGIRRGFPDARTLRLFLDKHDWVFQEPVDLPEEIEALRLDRGEKEAIALANLKNALLLMDEERGRSAARKMNIQARGSLGVLIEAYRKELISEVRLRFCFEEIMNRNDIWISGKLCERLLSQLFGDDCRND